MGFRYKFKQTLLLLGMSLLTLVYSVIMFVIVVFYALFMPFMKLENFHKTLRELWSNIPTLNKYDK